MTFLAPAQVLRHIVDLHEVLRATRDRGSRARLRRVERGLRNTLGPSVPKRQAAQALGVTVAALDHWIDRGALPVVAHPGSSRLQIERDAVLDLLERVTALREEGRTRGLLASALQGRHDPELEGRRVLRADVAVLPRPNVSERELRRHADRTTPAERIVATAALSEQIATLAGAARRRERPT